MTLNEFQAEMAKLNEWAQHGCSDGGCQIEPPKGMHTNGRCRCFPSDFYGYLRWLTVELGEYKLHRQWKKDAPETSTNKSDA